jgi:hypothetical protein
MFALNDIADALATKGEIELRGSKYVIKNATFATDGERVIKLSVVLSCVDDLKIADIDMSVRIY